MSVTSLPQRLQCSCLACGTVCGAAAGLCQCLLVPLPTACKGLLPWDCSAEAWAPPVTQDQLGQLLTTLTECQ